MLRGTLSRGDGVQAVGRFFKRGLAWWSLVWGVVYAVLFAIAASIPGMPGLVLWILGGLALLCAGAGAFILREVKGNEQAEARRLRIRIVTGIAHRQRGIVTVADVVAQAHLSIEEAREGLRDCVDAGLCELDADQRGVLIWRFHAFQHPELESGRLPWLEDLRHDPATDRGPPTR